MICFTDSVENITPEMLAGFFEGWVLRPSAHTHLEILASSPFVVLAIDESVGRVVGFINAISDNVLSAYVPLLEVLPQYRNRGVGKELLTRMLAKLDNFYMIDLVCERKQQPFHASCGMSAAEYGCTAMMVRNHRRLPAGR